MRKYIVEKNIVTFANGKVEILPYKVAASLAIDEYIIILTEKYPNKIIDNKNMYCYDIHGDFIWKIGFDKHAERDCPYIDLFYDKAKDILLSRNWCTYKVAINYHTGEIISHEVDYSK